ncbi:hypothetical protein M3Y99_01203800 [Aphelenchoides fujianensis]|nr:hypothetical protein M3Y99_01203800 [Aphelenchoides fujianensis]
MDLSAIVSKLPPFFSLLIFVPLAQPIFTPPPASRIKGEIACYSCWATHGHEAAYGAVEQPTNSSNVEDVMHIIREAGMNVPTFAEKCADVTTPGNVDVSGAKVHLCVNSASEPGTCVKLKGYLNGEAYVYRDCWEKMWRDPRPFHHRMSGKCFNDATVQNFIDSKENTICFCEDDLCNHSSRWTPALLVPAALLLIQLPFNQR